MALPEQDSDNVGRVRRICAFAEAWFGRGELEGQIGPERDGQGQGPRLLDVGSGLGVFPARMKAAGWRCTALDPDPRSVDHARYPLIKIDESSRVVQRVYDMTGARSRHALVRAGTVDIVVRLRTRIGTI